MAKGSLRVWLQPHLVDAMVELWYRSYGADVKTGNLVKPGWEGGDPATEPYYLPGDPFTAYDLYTVKFPQQEVNGVWYKATELGHDFTFQGDWEYTLLLEVSPSGLITLYGRCVGGHPTPGMLLEIYLEGELTVQYTIPTEELILNKEYVLETAVAEPGIHTVHGRMVLSNPLGDAEYTTTEQQFEL